MNTPLENCLKLVANSLETLRRVDVYRVLDAANQIDQLEAMSVVIRGARPDLAMQLDVCRIEIQAAELATPVRCAACEYGDIPMNPCPGENS